MNKILNMNYLRVKILSSLFILFLIGFSASVYSQAGTTYRSFFAFNLNQSNAGGTEHFGIMRIYEDGSQEFKILSRYNWILQAYGVQESEANPDTINYFMKYNLEVKILGELWKLRYGEYPYKSQTEKFGWAQTPYCPSDAQLSYLKKYGFKFISTTIYGDNAFSLLRDMMSPEWIDNYSNLSD